jgi:outer membrane receptor protein involved in Fe transport
MVCSIPLNAEEIFLSDIIVKSELQEKDIQDTMTSAVVIEGLELDESTDATFYDVVKRTSGITSISGERGFGIRGISSREAVNITLDGMTIPTERASVLGPYGTWDLEQIEILRGAQSTQSGRNALAGAIHIRTANPTFDETSKLRVNIGSKDSTSVSLMHNQPLIDDVLAVRIAGEVYNTDGWITNTTLNDDRYNAQEMKMIRTKLLWKPLDNLKVILGYSVTNNVSGDDTVEYATWPKYLYNTSNEEAHEGTVSRVATLNLEYTINDNWTLKSLTGQYLSAYTYRQDFDLRAYNGGLWDEKEDGNTFTEELKVVYNSENIRGVFGLFYTKIKRDTDDGIVDVPGGFLDASLDPFNLKALIHTFIQQDIENKAIFGEIEYDFNKNWTLVAGARYDRESISFKSEIVGKITDPGFLPPALIPGIESQINSKTNHSTVYATFLPKVGLVYHLNEQENFGLSYQKGYRPGGSDLNAFTQTTYEYDPEYTDTVEFSYRYQSENKKTTFNSNIFYTAWKDMQVFVQNPGNIHNKYGSSKL